MNILQALFFPPEQPGGVSSMVPYMLDRFNRRGWEMELFSLPKRVRGKGTAEVEFETFDWRQYRDSPRVMKYIQTFKDYEWWTKLRVHKSYDLIHAHHPIAGLVMKRCFPDTPVVMTLHSSYERELILNGLIEENSAEHKFLVSLYAELEHQTDQLMTVSQSFKHYLSSYVKQPDRIIVIPNGYDEKRFKPVQHDNPVTQFITVCRLVPAKGLDILLHACADLKRRGHPFVLHIIGDGQSRPELEQLALELGIYEDTIFYGYMLHPEEFMPFFDVFVLPSRAEAFGSVFAEAALCGLALIGTDVGGIAEQIEHDKNGLLVPVNAPDALADAMETFITNREKREQLARSGQAKAMNAYSMTKAVQQLRRVYRPFRKPTQ